jgi:hypothetical protein
LEVVGQRLAGRERTLADEHGDRRLRRHREVRELDPVHVAAPYLEAAFSLLRGACGVVVDLRRNGGGDPGTVALVLDWLMGAEPTHISDVIYRGRTRQWWTTGQPVEREHANAIGTPPDAADRAAAQRNVARILRRPARGVRVGHERSVGDVLERHVPRVVVRDRLDLAAQLAVDRAKVVAEPLAKRALEPLTAAGIRKQPVDPPAQLGYQRPHSAGCLARHVASVARPARADARLPQLGRRPQRKPVMPAGGVSGLSGRPGGRSGRL